METERRGGHMRGGATFFMAYALAFRDAVNKYSNGIAAHQQAVSNIPDHDLRALDAHETI
jgi:hypothetical protein